MISDWFWTPKLRFPFYCLVFEVSQLRSRAQLSAIQTDTNAAESSQHHTVAGYLKLFMDRPEAWKLDAQAFEGDIGRSENMKTKNFAYLVQK